MTRPLLALLFVLSCGTAAAQTVTVTNEAGQSETVRTEAASADQAADKSDAATKAAASTCLQSTGSRIVATRNLRAERTGKPAQCATASGRVYTSDDLQRSGRVDLYDALRALDTGVR